jgi:6-phosphofructokinase 2
VAIPDLLTAPLEGDGTLGDTTSGHRIVTLTMNPALDISTGTRSVYPTHKLRCDPAHYDAGGGGINVARVARVLGAAVFPVFPAGGPAGELLGVLLERDGVPYRRIGIAGWTRESFTVNELSTGQQYRFVLPGPTLSETEQDQCLVELRAAARSAEFVVASGSLPPGVGPGFLQRVADLCSELGPRLILDTSGAGLGQVRSGVFLLKPSLRELSECVGRVLATESEQLAAAHELIERKCATNVLVSLGEDGAVLATPSGGQRYSPVDVPGGSGVGAGDAMVAGLVVGLGRRWTLREAVRLGMATGAAMLLTPGTEACRRDDVERLLPLVAQPVEAELTRC